MMPAVTVERIARTCHEANRALCIAFGDLSQPVWDEAPDWQRTSAINGVLYRLDNPDATPEQMHESWMAEKVAGGWVYGEVKAPDATPPTHPCIRPYGELPETQRAKDHVFSAIVSAMTYSKPMPAEVQPQLPQIKFGHSIVVNTPGRPLNGITQHAAIVTAVHSETMCSAYVIPAGGAPFHAASLQREDLVDRINFANLPSWSFTS